MSKYPFKLDKWEMEESEIDVNVPDIDVKTGKVVGFKKESMPIIERVYRSEAKSQQLVCGDHNYECVDKHKYIFKCTRCSYSRIAYPCSYDLLEGKLVPRETRQK
jgi:hypothetical protein